MKENYLLPNHPHYTMDIAPNSNELAATLQLKALEANEPRRKSGLLAFVISLVAGMLSFGTLSFLGHAYLGYGFRGAAMLFWQYILFGGAWLLAAGENPLAFLALLAGIVLSFWMCVDLFVMAGKVNEKNVAYWRNVVKAQGLARIVATREAA